MKLATRKSKNRDGELVVVSKDLSKAVLTCGIAANLQYALDHWSDVAPQLQKLSNELNAGNIKDAFTFEEEKIHSPLPRAYQWLDGSAYLNHVELVRKARGAEMPKEFLTDPLMYQGCSDSFLGPRDPILMENEEWGIDFESEVAVITDDVPMGVDTQSALKHIKLILLVNDVSLRNLIPQELGKGFGFLVSKPPSAFSPVAVTPEELGDSWQEGKLHLPLHTNLNGSFFGKPNAGVDMQFNFGQLIAHAAKTRPLAAGTILGSGTISNKDRSVGSSCLAEIRMLEIIEKGKPSTPFMKFGDEVKIWMEDLSGKSIFGTIQQKVKRYEK